MKILHIVSFAAIALLTVANVSSCKKDDVSNTPAIAGEWEMRSFHQTRTRYVTTPPTIIQTDTSFESGKGIYINFRTDNTFVTRAYYSASQTRDSGTYSYASGRLISIEIRGPNRISDTADVILNGNDFSIHRKDSVNSSQSDENSYVYSRR